MANRHLEIMARYMSELGLTPSARSRVATGGAANVAGVSAVVRFAFEEGDEPEGNSAPCGSRPFVELPANARKL